MWRIGGIYLLNMWWFEGEEVGEGMEAYEALAR